MRNPLLPGPQKGGNHCALVASLLALLLGSLALFMASKALLGVVELQSSPVQQNSPVQLQTIKAAAPRANTKTPIAAIAPPTRHDIAFMYLEARHLEIGIELGVQKGEFASHNLRHWPSCKRYYLVDIWKQQENYTDWANVPNEVQDKFLKEAQNNLKDFTEKTIFLRNYTTEAVSLIKEQVDFIYVDARHDYCGTKQDIELYWPLLKSGGILAGHDYLDAPTVKKMGQDWALCMDGSIHDGAVKGAVNEFAVAQGLTVMVTYNDPPWVSWLAVKP